MPDYAVTVFVSKEGYLKKITAQSLRMSGEQKFKEGDSLVLLLRDHQQGGISGIHRPVPVLQVPPVRL